MNQLLETGKGKSSGALSADKISNFVRKVEPSQVLFLEDSSTSLTNIQPTIPNLK